MKFLLFVFVFASCSDSAMQKTSSNPDSTSTEENSNSVDSVSGKSSVIDSWVSASIPPNSSALSDSVQINQAIEQIYQLEEVKQLDQLIKKNTSGKQGVAIMVDPQLMNESGYYAFNVGNNHEDRYENIYTFLVRKSGTAISVYDPVLDSVLTLEDWRKQKKKM